MKSLVFLSFLQIFGVFTLKAQWINLIDRHHLSDYSKDANCTIIEKAGAITYGTKGEEAWLATEKQYANFRLKGEFLLDEGATAQIFFRVGDPDTKIPELSGYAVQFDKDADQQNCLGSIINISRAIWIDSIDFKRWNSFEIIAQQDHLIVLINGNLVTETHNRRSPTGVIKIKMTGKGDIFRNVKIMLPEDVSIVGPTAEDYLHSYPGINYEQIFDGKTLKGWKSTGTSVWKVIDGTLSGYSGKEGGFLVSDGIYKDFHLKFQFKILKEDNSGIFIRKPGMSEEISLENSIECNIYDHNGFTHAFSTGALVRHARAWSQMISYNDWNTGEIYALGDHIIMYINGIKASETHLPNYNHSGQLCLQAGLQLALPEHGPSGVSFKDIWIKCIDKN
ncbi:MAG: DUF1080 domain-containing protein [Saprospiraceae bacterium]|nr:DUF1080 domain-containing protein [Saprospiraceae bacterium]